MRAAACPSSCVTQHTASLLFFACLSLFLPPVKRAPSVGSITSPSTCNTKKSKINNSGASARVKIWSIAKQKSTYFVILLLLIACSGSCGNDKEMTGHRAVCMSPHFSRSALKAANQYQATNKYIIVQIDIYFNPPATLSAPYLTLWHASIAPWPAGSPGGIWYDCVP